MKIFYILFFFILLCLLVGQINTIRCANKCEFDTIPIGSLDPFKIPCNTIEIDITTTVCTVDLTINFATTFVEGILQIRPRLTSKSPTLNTRFTLNSRTTIGSIIYACTSTDNCDQEFVREAIGSPKWLEIHEVVVRLEISTLIFKTDSSLTDILCTNNVICPSNNNCYTQIVEKRTGSQTSTINFNSSDTCDTTVLSDVRFDRYFNTLTNDEIMTIDIRCNKNNCNQQKIVEEVYGIIRDEFTFPLNYSSFIPDTSGFHNINRSTNISLLFYLIFIIFSAF